MSAVETGKADVARWDARYRTDDYVFGTAPNAVLAAQAHRLGPGMSVLAVADGEGRNGVWLAAQGMNAEGTGAVPGGRHHLGDGEAAPGCCAGGAGFRRSTMPMVVPANAIAARAPTPLKRKARRTCR